MISSGDAMGCLKTDLFVDALRNKDLLQPHLWLRKALGRVLDQFRHRPDVVGDSGGHSGRRILTRFFWSDHSQKSLNVLCCPFRAVAPS